MNEEIQELIDLYTPLDGSDEYLRELYRKLSEEIKKGEQYARFAW